MMKPRLALALSILFAAPLLAGNVELSPDSTLAVVTGKGGLAGGMAHNHFIAAKPEATFDFDEANPPATTFELTAVVEALQVDPFDLEKTHYPRLEKLAILSEPFTEVPEKDRRKIRESMMDKGQLNQASFPNVKARIASIVEKPFKQGDTTFPYTVTLALEVVGKSVEKPVGARYELKDGALTVEAVGAFKFTDFGIKPYSAFLGAVKVLDDFHVYVSLHGKVAMPEPAPVEETEESAPEEGAPAEAAPAG